MHVSTSELEARGKNVSDSWKVGTSRKSEGTLRVALA